jgi:hypothetical membrane protein
MGALISAITYRGKLGETYSPLNHFISELGEVGVAQLAWAFNLGLMVSGVSLILGSTSLGLILPGLLAKIGMAAGIISSIGLFFVGVFPMSNMKPHFFTALTYFRAGLLMMIIFNLAIALQPVSGQVLPRVYSLAGLPTILSFAGFLFIMHRVRQQDNSHNPLSAEGMERPRIWPIAIIEWSIFVTIVIWFLLIAIGL